VNRDRMTKVMRKRSETRLGNDRVEEGEEKKSEEDEGSKESSSDGSAFGATEVIPDATD
jgi:hypothetical protein